MSFFLLAVASFPERPMPVKRERRPTSRKMHEGILATKDGEHFLP